MSVEYRKLQLSSMGSYLITLPRSWVEKLGWGRGTQLVLRLEDNRVVVTGDETEQPARKPLHKIYIEDFPNRKLLELCLNASYIQGNDVTEILSRDKIKAEHRKWIREALDAVIGSEIAEEFSDRVVLQNLIDPLKFPLDAVVNRFSDVAMAVYTDAVKALNLRDKDLALDAYERGADSAKLYRLLMRQVIQCSRSPELAGRMELEEPGEVIVMALTVRELSRIAYYAMRIAEHVSEIAEQEIEPVILKSISEMHRIAMRMHKDAMTALKEKNLQLAGRVIDSMEQLREVFDNSLKELLKSKADYNTVKHLLLILRNFRAIGGYAVGLADNATLRIFSKAKEVYQQPQEESRT